MEHRIVGQPLCCTDPAQGVRLRRVRPADEPAVEEQVGHLVDDVVGRRETGRRLDLLDVGPGSACQSSR